MTLLIVFNDGTERRVENVTDFKAFGDINCFKYTTEESGFWAFVPKENVSYFGPEELWVEPEKNADWDKIIACVESCKTDDIINFEYRLTMAHNNALIIAIEKLKRLREEK